MRAFVLNVAASVVGGIILAIVLPLLPVPQMWTRYWPELIGMLFVFLWLGGFGLWWVLRDYFALRRFTYSRRYGAFQAWLRFHPDYEPIANGSLDGLIVSMQEWNRERLGGTSTGGGHGSEPDT